jgi:hypothetical protein
MSQFLNCKQADISISASGDNTVVAAVSGRPIKVHQIFLVANAAVNVKFKDGASSDLNATAINLSSGGAITLQYTGQPWWVTTVGNAFIINLSGAVACTGRVYYTEG